MLRPRPAVLAALGATVLLLTACTSGSGSSGPSTPAPGPTSEVTATSAPPTAPVSTGPTTAATATSCPLAGTAFVRDTMGVRLGRLTRLRADGRVVGCRFYALQGGSLHASEHLPGPNQPVVEITTQRYPSSVAAHNAFVRRAGGSATQTQFGSVTGLCFQNAFDPQDKGQDWACTVNKGAVLVLVRTVDTTGTFSTATLLKTVLRAVTV